MILRILPLKLSFKWHFNFYFPTSVLYFGQFKIEKLIVSGNYSWNFTYKTVLQETSLYDVDSVELKRSWKVRVDESAQESVDTLEFRRLQSKVYETNTSGELISSSVQFFLNKWLYAFWIKIFLIKIS